MNENNVEKYLNKHMIVVENYVDNKNKKELDIIITEISADGITMKVTGDIVDALVIKDFEDDFTIVDIVQPETDKEIKDV